jgi:hypothetical protein
VPPAPRLFQLQKYSSDLNPIEQFFANQTLDAQSCMANHRAVCQAIEPEGRLTGRAN